MNAAQNQSTETASPAVPAEVAHREAMRAFTTSNYAKLHASYHRNRYFHSSLIRLVANQVLPGSSVLDIGCGTGEMLAALKPSRGVGIDMNPLALAEARARHPELEFHELAAEDLGKLPERMGEPCKFDYVILSDVLPQLYDLHTVLSAIRSVCHDRTRLIISTFSRLWQPLISFSETTGRKARVPDESWIPSMEVRNLLGQCDFQVVRQINGILMPLGIPLLSNFINRWISPLPGINQLNLCTLSIARLLPSSLEPAVASTPRQKPSGGGVSVIIPARNEAGHLQQLLDRLPTLTEVPSQQEVIFIEGNSTDNTWEVMQQVVTDYQQRHTGQPGWQVSCYQQTGRGKADAVRLGYSKAQGDILIILDADISVPPEELPRFVQLIASGHCEFANGSRLVYPMEKKAMRFLNMIANKGFGWMFTFLLGQNLRDTLCGTKVLRRTDYLRIAAHRAYFGEFDPYGDFDLLFGAARLNLKIVDVPVHYKQRIYGETNISRFRGGMILLRMCWFAARKIKFI